MAGTAIHGSTLFAWFRWVSGFEWVISYTGKIQNSEIHGG